MAQAYDLAVAWNWEYDTAFVDLLAAACRARGLSLLQITPATVAGIVGRLRADEVAWRALLDRAWDVDEEYYALADESRSRGARILNYRPLALRAWDKATMHLEFMAAGLHTPHTLILPPFAQAPDLPMPDLSPLGGRFILKPAHGGGGSGVADNPVSWAQVQQLRTEFPADKYLIQAVVEPRRTEIAPAWFRVLYALGDIWPLWWDVRTHRYRPVTSAEETRFGLSPLRHIAHAIARVCRLDIFSTEIAQRAADGIFVSVDYVNDPIDLRPQSAAADGVPDTAVRGIAERIVGWVSSGP